MSQEPNNVTVSQGSGSLGCAAILLFILIILFSGSIGKAVNRWLDIQAQRVEACER